VGREAMPCWGYVCDQHARPAREGEGSRRVKKKGEGRRKDRKIGYNLRGNWNRLIETMYERPGLSRGHNKPQGLRKMKDRAGKKRVSPT